MLPITPFPPYRGIIDNDSLLKIELAAYLHDIEDYKYSGSDEKYVPIVRDILKDSGYTDKDTVEAILNIIKGVSFHGELASKMNPSVSSSSSSSAVSTTGSSTTTAITIETACVQDADRLDAIGAIGIARCLTYGGAKHRTLYDPNELPLTNITKEEYMQRKSTTINHFYEKLLLLKDKMKTTTGKRIAEERHKFMLLYLDQFFQEWNGQR